VWQEDRPPTRQAAKPYILASDPAADTGFDSEPEPVAVPSAAVIRAAESAAAQPTYASVVRAPEPTRGDAGRAPAEPKRRGGGLFARVTGSSTWSRQGEGREPPMAPPARSMEAPSRSEPPARPEPAPTRIEPAARTAPARAVAQPAGQPRLSGLDPRERLQSSHNDEDVLDIPAFLRRQAN
jgi:cell division protein FtsZ